MAALILFVSATTPATAQEVQRIAAVVNDEVVSIFDVQQRAELLISSAGLPDTPETRQRLIPQVLRGLIDEKLQIQEAQRRNIRVSENELDEAIERIEQANNIPPGQFDTFLSRMGVSRDAAVTQIRNNLMWQKLIARRIIPDISIGEEEIDAVIDRIEGSAGKQEYHVAEILLPVDNPTDRPQIADLAHRLVGQLRQGSDFAPVAQQFSKSASAATGGDIGWIQQGALGAPLDGVIADLEIGGISEPVETPDGLQIVKLLDRRTNTGVISANQTVQLRQMMLRVPVDAPPAEVDSQMALARTISETTQGCADFAAAASELGSSQPDSPSEFQLADLNETLRPVAEALPVGQASEPLRGPGGIQVIMVCARDDGSMQVREEIHDSLMRERVDMLSRRYLRDLRRAAFVDVRV